MLKGSRNSWKNNGPFPWYKGIDTIVVHQWSIHNTQAIYLVLMFYCIDDKLNCDSSFIPYRHNPCPCKHLHWRKRWAGPSKPHTKEELGRTLSTLLRELRLKITREYCIQWTDPITSFVDSLDLFSVRINLTFQWQVGSQVFMTWNFIEVPGQLLLPLQPCYKWWFLCSSHCVPA